jgi:hypothetical protein
MLAGTILGAAQVQAQESCTNSGDTTFCSDGSSGTSVGDTTYYNNGDISQRVGDTTYFYRDEPTPPRKRRKVQD